MSEHTMDINHLKSRIEREEYSVDPRAVADAILAMLRREFDRAETPPATG